MSVRIIEYNLLSCYTIQHRTVFDILPSYPPDNHHSSDIVYRGGEEFTKAIIQTFCNGTVPEITIKWEIPIT